MVPAAVLDPVPEDARGKGCGVADGALHVLRQRSLFQHKTGGFWWPGAVPRCTPTRHRRHAGLGSVGEFSAAVHRPRSEAGGHLHRPRGRRRWPVLRQGPAGLWLVPGSPGLQRRVSPPTTASVAPGWRDSLGACPPLCSQLDVVKSCKRQRFQLPEEIDTDDDANGRSNATGQIVVRGVDASLRGKRGAAPAWRFRIYFRMLFRGRGSGKWPQHGT